MLGPTPFLGTPCFSLACSHSASHFPFLFFLPVGLGTALFWGVEWPAARRLFHPVPPPVRCGHAIFEWATAGGIRQITCATGNRKGPPGVSHLFMRITLSPASDHIEGQTRQRSDGKKCKEEEGEEKRGIVSQQLSRFVSPSMHPPIPLLCKVAVQLAR